MNDQQQNNSNEDEKRRAYRDEHFWVTAAVVAVNTVVLEKDPPGLVGTIVSLLVSLLGFHIVLTRSMEQAGMGKECEKEQDTCLKRLLRTWCEVRVAWKRIPWIFAECSGSLFYLLLIGITCAAAVFRMGHCHV